MIDTKSGVENVLVQLKKIGVPNDGRWQTLILYLRFIAEYNYLTVNQKQKIQELLVSVLKNKKFDNVEYNKVNKELGKILFEPYKMKLKEALKESTELIKKFAEMSTLRKKHIENLEQNTIQIIEKSDDIEDSIKKIKEAFKQVIELMDNDIKALYDEIKMDGLTSLYNRKFLDKHLNEIVHKCKQNKIPCVIMMLDIDDFKNINDKYGHTIGDQALKMVSNIIKKKGEEYLLKKNRGNFFPARYGGEEFCIVLENFELNESVELAEKIRSGIEKYNFVIRNGEGKVVEDGIKITLSIGLAQLREDIGGDSWIERADQALYMAKSLGKNRVEVYKAK